MPKSYTIYQMSEFPNAREIAVPYQAPLIPGVEATATYMRQMDRVYGDLPIRAFEVYHELLVHKFIKAQGQNFNEFVEPYTFNAFYHDRARALLACGPKDIVRKAISDLIESGTPNIQGETRQINLLSLHEYILSTKGAYFRIPHNANIRSQALFGESIDQDPMFNRAINEGEPTYMNINYGFRDRLIIVGISANYRVVVYQNMDEQSELELVLDVKTNLLDLAEDKN